MPPCAIAVADGPSAVEIVRPILVVLWAAAGLLLGLRRRRERLAPIVLGGAIVGAIGTLAAAMLAHRALDGPTELAWDVALRFAAALLPAVALHLLLGLVDGRLVTPIRRNTVVAGYVTGVVIGVGLIADRERLVGWPLVVFWLAAWRIGLYAAHARYVKAGAEDRRRHAVDRLGHGGGRRGRRRRHRPPAAQSTGPTTPSLSPSPSPVSSPSASPAGRCRGWSPASIVCSPTPSPSPGLTALIVAIYVIVILGLGRTPTG